MREKKDRNLTTIFYNHLDLKTFPAGFVRKDSILAAISSAIVSYCHEHYKKFACDDETLERLSQDIWQDWIEFGAIDQQVADFAGEYYRINRGGLSGFREAQLRDNPILEQAALIGSSFFRDVLAGISNLSTDNEEKNEENSVVHEAIPASDRIVTLSDNDKKVLEEPLEEVAKLVEMENSIDGEDGLRELVLGRLRAGRELIRAGIFSVQSLQLTLVVGLKMLVDRYGDTAIGIVAAELLDLLLKQYGIG